MPSTATSLLLITVVLLCVSSAHAFGAGDIPEFSYVSGKAFRHGDIEGILESLSKSAGGAAAGGILGFAQSVLAGGKGPKFSKQDVKRVYFGNWLRDYSQAMDIAGLSKLSADTLVLVLAVLGFMTFGYSTEEFELTADRLGVYLPVEHIDNPKGYAAKEGDAREYHPKLRPPVEDRELEVDESNGMKKYIATENEGFDSSAAHIRRIFTECIKKGREARGQEGADLWEAFRLLGTGLHTLEDFPAHSNFTELTLLKMGHEVFCHVGDNVRINTPNGEAPPIVTGTFGASDFLHSLMGEATDKISQSSVTDLAATVNKASAEGDNNSGALKAILSKIPSGGGEEKANQMDDIQNKSKAYHFDPDNAFPPEVQKTIKDVLVWHDDVMRDIQRIISRIPGLEDLLENLTNAMNAYIFTVIAPYITPVLTQVTEALGEGSKAVIDSDDQYEVFNNPDASDPSHSMLSKDHFNLILNEPAGLVAQTVVEHTVNAIVQAWSDDSNPNEVINKILEAIHHPFYADGQSEIQNAMRETVERWFQGLGSEADEIIEKLSKDGVKEHRNVRAGSEQASSDHAHGGGYQGQQSYGAHQASYGGRQQGSYGQSESYGGRQQGSYGQPESYGGHQQGSYGQPESYGGHQQGSYGQSESYGGRQQDSYGQPDSYGGRQQGSYGRSESYGTRQQGSYGQTESYGGRQQSSYGQSESYGGHQHGSYGQSESYGGESYGRQHGGGYGESEDTYGSRRTDTYGQSESYGSRNKDTYGESESYGRSGYGGGGYQSQEGYGGRHESSYGESESHGGRQHSSYGSGYERKEPEHSYGREERSGYHQRRDDNDEYGSGNRHYGGGNQGYEQQSRSYGNRYGGEEEQSGYGGRRHSESGEEEHSGYAREKHEGRYGRHSKRRDSHDSRDSDDSEDHKRSSYGHHGDNEFKSGYNPSYSRDDDTYGAERLNIHDDDMHGSRRHHARRHHDDDD